MTMLRTDINWSESQILFLSTHEDWGSLIHNDITTLVIICTHTNSSNQHLLVPFYNF